MGRAKVVFSYAPTCDDELTLEVDAIVEVTAQVEEGWWQGVVNGKQGLFPSNFVELIEEEPEAEKIVQAKKVKGVGLGNIFGNAPIKLRSSDVRPSIRRHDIPSAEKKDSPELKNKKGSPRDLPTSPRDAHADQPSKDTKEPKEAKRGEFITSPRYLFCAVMCTHNQSHV
ncbi:hypothetical protein NP493_607g01034 [Ridgeia piscesae]|uniref:SH3 domain-containing protein n=1 Tax=Ridgeia piscesae TaxID=27915 RepID=A0AAD9NQT0_RIDPI|nr:hypothetical protein NP493_607g01034 [Ridgeia piscesae]